MSFSVPSDPCRVLRVALNRAGRCRPTARERRHRRKVQRDRADALDQLVGIRRLARATAGWFVVSPALPRCAFFETSVAPASRIARRAKFPNGLKGWGALGFRPAYETRTPFERSWSFCRSW